MTITAVPAVPGEPEDIRAVESEFAPRDQVTGPAETPETQVLDSIFSVAASHDTVCQYAESRIYKQLGLDGQKLPKKRGDDSELNDYVYSVIGLCAILAPAAMRRIPAPVFAKAIAGSGEIESLKGAELDAFLRPIFEESGIGERFEVRTGYQVYRDPEATRPN